MKIIFICGCLEPGKDGVGDYTRRLAGELIRQDIPVGMIAYNDPFVSEEVLEQQVSEGTAIPCLCLPAIWNGSKRCAHAKVWVQQHAPEWLSLQFVPYAFHNKGLPFGLAQQLKQLGGDIKWHIMFHELWIGMEEGATQKDVLIGTIQKHIIKRLTKKLNPKAVHTQTQLYQAQLGKIKVKSGLLPLFSNIPLFDIDVLKSLSAKKETGLKVELILFGSIHPEAPVEEFAKEVSEYYDKIGNDILKCLTLIGRSGIHKQEWKEIFKSYNFVIKDLGEQSEENIFRALQMANIGITTTPIYLADKSGTTISMKDHNLPIISVSKKWRPKNGLKIDFHEDVMEYEKGNFSKFLELKYNQSGRHNIRGVVKKYINSLFFKQSLN